MNSRSSLALLLFVLTVGACVAGGGPDGIDRSPTAATGGMPALTADSTGEPDPNDTRNIAPRQKVCTDPSDPSTCTCLRLALVGTLDSAANEKDTGPFVDWLNANSDNTATATMVPQKPTITADWLSQYDVIISANINDWTFSAQEKAAMETWVRTTGGGILALTGFVSTTAEPAATSQLIAWSGVQFNSTRTAEGGQGVPVYYQGGTTDLKNCLAWTQSSDAIITTPVQFTQQTGALQRLTYQLDYVGAYTGYGVDAPPGAVVLATDPVSGANMAVAHEVDGMGRIVAFGDEWILFANQWVPEGQPPNQQPDQYNVCYIPPEDGNTAEFHSVQTLYQTKQFWYDAINWVAPPNDCGFVIDDPDVVVILL
ncbi:MAG: hypothetical protein JW940_17600 [Polyangiaceae bacterium]|nr:hypothetical protein [Polyangiaceae bacterium]